MKKLLSYLVIMSFFANGFAQNYTEIEKSLFGELSKENWQYVFDNFSVKKDKKATDCENYAVNRFLFGHAAMIIGKNSISTNQFYCNCDSVNSKTLNDWLVFTKNFKNNYPGIVASYLLSDAYARNALFEQAKTEIDSAIILNPNHVPSLNLCAVIYWLLYENSNPKNNLYKLSALTKIKKAISINPKFADLFANKAIFTMRNVGDMNSSRVDLNNALRIDSTYYLVQNSLAFSYGEEGVIEKYNDIKNNIIKHNSNTPFINLVMNKNSLKGNNERGFSASLKLNLKIPVPQLLGLADIKASFDYNSERGGVFTYLKEGENLKTENSKEPILIGTWFNLNYPNKIQIVNSKKN